MSELEKSSDHWSDDQFDRKQLAQRLTNFILANIASKDFSESGLSISVDAPWGYGKTFFITRWQKDLDIAGIPYAHFDAWANDLGEEAAIPLMSVISEALLLKAPHKLAAKARDLVSDATASLRRAILPASKVILAGLVKKATGIGVDEIIEAIDLDVKQESIPNKIDKIVNDGLDAYFDKALDEHKKRKDSIVIFKEKIIKLQELGHEEPNRLPLLVFVDELDRCRPTYALTVLEEIKHIFGTKNVCFVFSTNIDQLQKSIKAVYGNEFNSSMYLKRFFDYQIEFPSPRFAGGLFINEIVSEILKGRHIISCMPQSTYQNTSINTDKAFVIINDAFDLDIRSAKQVVNIFKAAVYAILPSQKIYVLWLYFLCALKFKNSNLLRLLRDGEITFSDVLKHAEVKNITLLEAEPRREFQGMAYSQGHKQVGLYSVLIEFFNCINIDLKEIARNSHSLNTLNYPDSFKFIISQEMPNPHNPGLNYPVSFVNYFDAVQFSGFFKD